jgi:hypothetical protein
MAILPDLVGVYGGVKEARCWHCGRAAAAYFSAGGRVTGTCTACAVDWLPKLMADAVVAGVPPGESPVPALAAALMAVQKHFWYAASVSDVQRRHPTDYHGRPTTPLIDDPRLKGHLARCDGGDDLP